MAERLSKAQHTIEEAIIIVQREMKEFETEISNKWGDFSQWKRVIVWGEIIRASKTQTPG